MKTSASFFVVCIVFIGSAVILGDSDLNHDTSWYLISTLWFIEGIPIYQEILELNPPLAFYLTIPPVFLAKITGIDPTFAMKGYVLALSAISIFLGNRILKFDGRLTENEIGFVNCVVSVGLVIIPLSVFGQREHLMLIFAWPYVALAMTDQREQGLRSSLAIGFISSFGFAIKPYFLVIPLLISFFAAFQARKLQPIFSAQNIAILVFCIGYVVFSLIFHPAYFAEVIPKITLVYDVYDIEILAALEKIQIGLIFFLLLVVVLLFTISLNRKNSISIPIAAAALGGLISYLVQSKGWYYHQLPFHVFSWILASFLFLILIKEVKSIAPRLILILFYLLVVIFSPVISIIYGHYKNQNAIQLSKHFNCSKPDQTYQMFSSKVSSGFPLANRNGVEPAVRSPTMWVFPGIVKRLSENIEAIEREFLENELDNYTQAIIDDLLRVKPQLVFIDDSEYKTYFHGVKFNYIEHFSQYSNFSEDWKNYTFIEKAHGHKVYKRNNCYAKN